MKNFSKVGSVALALVLILGGTLSAAQKPAKVAGTWEMTSQGRQGTTTSTMTIEQTGDKIKGTIQGPRGDNALEGTVKGNEVSFTVKLETPRGEMTMEYSGKVEGDTMKGVRKTPRGETEWTAKRVK
jgi:hypothetical protein